MSEKKIYKIVITGGPCAGKTTAMSWLRNGLAKKGYTVLFCPETATELISGGVAPWTCTTNVEYQRCQLKLQYAKEQVFLQAANHMPQDKIIIIFDRAFMDNRVYMSNEEFLMLLDEMGFTEQETLHWYDAVFHLVTAAKGEEKYYTLANNGARIETVEQACEIDDKLIQSWEGHPNHFVIDNSSDFEHKMVRLLKEFYGFLGEQEPHETKRKFLIKYPDVNKLAAIEGCKKEEIIQTYLTGNENKEVRVRQVGSEGNFIYYKTAKYTLTDVQPISIQENLSKEQYRRQLLDAETNCNPIEKIRYSFNMADEFVKIDLYSFWDNQAIAEVETDEETGRVELPEFIEVIKEVTKDPEYKVHALAKK